LGVYEQSPKPPVQWRRQKKTLGRDENDVTYNDVILSMAWLGYPCAWGLNIFVPH